MKKLVKSPLRQNVGTGKVCISIEDLEGLEVGLTKLVVMKPTTKNQKAEVALIKTIEQWMIDGIESPEDGDYFLMPFSAKQKILHFRNRGKIGW